MIMKDFRYIIKRILIGLGIILGISFIRSCNVYALEDTSNMIFLGSRTENNWNGHKYNILYYYDNNNNNNRIYIKKTIDNNNVYESYYNIPNGYDYFYSRSSSTPQELENASDTKIGSLVFINSEIYMTYSGGYYYPYCNSNCNAIQLYGSLTNNSTVYRTDSFNQSTITNNLKSFNVGFTNFDIYNQDRTIKYFSNNLIPNPPKIISLNPTLNENDNVLVSVSFSPQFDYIDNDNYNYYAWFDGYNKFQITENNTPFNTRNNTTFYVEITDFQGNTIDSETYTVSRIGQFDYSEYDILFSVETYTESDTLNEQKPIDYINRVDIDITFMPKSAYLKYQYQFVNEGDSITNNWITINSESSSDLSKNNFVYTTHDNGTLYTQILDSEDNFLYSESYTITSIGMVKYYANDTGVGGFFNKITDKLDYSGPISSLISVPIRLFSSLLTESSKSCTSYSFGTLLGSEITFSCVNVENYIGSNLYNLLDLLMSFGVVLGIIHFIKKQYSNFMSMNDKTDDIM